jgi:hypothetical protein
MEVRPIVPTPTNEDLHDDCADRSTHKRRDGHRRPEPRWFHKIAPGVLDTTQPPGAAAWGF